MEFPVVLHEGCADVVIRLGKSAIDRNRPRLLISSFTSPGGDADSAGRLEDGAEREQVTRIGNRDRRGAMPLRGLISTRPRSSRSSASRTGERDTAKRSANSASLISEPAEWRSSGFATQDRVDIRAHQLCERSFSDILQSHQTDTVRI